MNHSSAHTYRLRCVYYLGFDGYLVKIDTGDDDDTCKRYLHLLLWLLNELNQIIENELQDFQQEEQKNPPSTHQNEHTAPRLSPDVLSIGMKCG